MTNWNWWLNEIPHAKRDIHLPDIDFTTNTDASEVGWEATYGSYHTGSEWLEEKGNLISYLELKAIYLAVKSYSRYWLSKKHIQFKSQHTTQFPTLIIWGRSVSEKYNELVKHLWPFWIQDTFTCHPFSLLVKRTL